MLTNTCPFANAIALPSLADAGIAALQSGDLLAVEAIARVMKRRYSAAVFSDAQVERGCVGAEAIAHLQQLGFRDNVDVQRYLDYGEMPQP